VEEDDQARDDRRGGDQPELQSIHVVTSAGAST
jgi:hypothetical protein